MSSMDLLQYVDPLIGSYNGGNVFVGATRPYSLAKAVADVNGENTAGFATDGSQVTGFSLVHDSGTGGNPSLGNFPVFPELCPEEDINNCVYSKTARGVNYVNSSVSARPGHFALDLTNGIHAEMAVGQRAALYSFTFPNSAATNQAKYSNSSAGPAAVNGSNISPLVLLDLTDLYDTRQNATISVDPDTGRMTGNGTFLPSFGSGYYVMHFCADFGSTDTSMRDNGLHVNYRAGIQPKDIFVTRGINAFYVQAGGWVRFNASTSADDTTVLVRQGISYISAEQACANAEVDIPGVVGDWNMQTLVNDTQDEWRQKLSTVSITPGNGTASNLLTLLYSAMYRTMIQPQNYTGENPLWDSGVPYFDSFYCIWDTFRTPFPFLTIIDPEGLAQMVRSLIDIQQHVGWLPDCRMSLCKGFTQG